MDYSVDVGIAILCVRTVLARAEGQKIVYSLWRFLTKKLKIQPTCLLAIYFYIEESVMSGLGLNGVEIAIGSLDIGIDEEAIEESHSHDQSLLLQSELRHDFYY